MTEDRLLTLEEVLRELKDNETEAVTARWGHYPRAPKGVKLAAYGKILGVTFLYSPQLDYTQKQPFVSRREYGQGPTLLIAAHLEDFTRVMNLLAQRYEELPDGIITGHPENAFVTEHYSGKRRLLYFGHEGTDRVLLYNTVDLTDMKHNFMNTLAKFKVLRPSIIADK